MSAQPGCLSCQQTSGTGGCYEHRERWTKLPTTDEQAERIRQLESELAALKGRIQQTIAIAEHQARAQSVNPFACVHPLTCGKDSRHAPLVPYVDGERLGLRCIDCDYIQEHVPEAVACAHRPSPQTPPNPHASQARRGDRGR